MREREKFFRNLLKYNPMALKFFGFITQTPRGIHFTNFLTGKNNRDCFTQIIYF